MSPRIAANHDETGFDPRPLVGDQRVTDVGGLGDMNVTRRHRWDAGTKAFGWPDLAFDVPAKPRNSAPLPVGYRNLALEYDFVAGALAEDARSEGRQLWLGVALAGGFIALLASGWGIPALAVAFTLAPVVGIGMEIFSREK